MFCHIYTCVFSYFANVYLHIISTLNKEDKILKLIKIKYINKPHVCTMYYIMILVYIQTLRRLELAVVDQIYLGKLVPKSTKLCLQHLY